MSAHHVQADAGPGQATRDLWIIDRTSAFRHLDEVVELACETDLLTKGGHAALELQQPHRDFPTLARLTDDEVGVGGRVVEEDLVEFRCAGELLDRADGDARLIERYQQEAETGVTSGTGFGPGDPEHPLRHMRQRRPDLLAVDDPGVVVEAGGGGDAGQVRPGARLGIALRPQLGHVDDARKETLLLLLGAELDERRAEQFLAEVIHPGGCVGAGVLAVEDDALFERRTTTAVARRPAQTRPARGGQVTVPGQPTLEELVLAAGTAAPLQVGELADEVVRQPSPHRGRELVGGLRGGCRPFAEVDGPIGEVDRGHVR